MQLVARTALTGTVATRPDAGDDGPEPGQSLIQCCRSCGPTRVEAPASARPAPRAVPAPGTRQRRPRRLPTSLDEDINAKLRSWKVPENEFTRTEKVTLRRLLSHSAGLTVHGFPGHATTEPVPTLVQVLDGAKPANTAAVRVDLVPGTKFRYSGGGTTIVQLALVDQLGKAFPHIMDETVIAALGLRDSTHQQPLPRERDAQTSSPSPATRNRCSSIPRTRTRWRC